MTTSIIQVHNLEANEFFKPLTKIQKQIEDLKKNLQPKIPTEYLTRAEVAELLKINLTTLWNYTKQKKLIAYGIGSRVYYKRTEIDNAIIKLEQ